MSILKFTGELLKQLRESEGLLLREVGAKLSIDPTLLSKIEQNKRLPTSKQILILSNFYFDYKFVQQHLHP